MPHHALTGFYETHWAENVRRNWPEPIHTIQHDAYGRYRPVTVNTIEVDIARSTAYKRPEASWRRMIPCFSAPKELQVIYGDEFHGPSSKAQLRCLRFQDHVQKQSREDTAGNSEESNQSDVVSWLTFGRLYDIVEAAWFGAYPSSAIHIQLDWTFENYIRSKPLIGQPWYRVRRNNCYRELFRERLFSKEIGGEGRILVMLPCYRISDPKRYAGLFKIGDGSFCPDALACDEVLDIPHRRLRGNLTET